MNCDNCGALGPKEPYDGSGVHVLSCAICDEEICSACAGDYDVDVDADEDRPGYHVTAKCKECVK